MPQRKVCKTHRWVFVGSTGRDAGGKIVRIAGKRIKTLPLHLFFRCSRCMDKHERDATPGERAFFAKHRSPYFDFLRTPRQGVHTTWRKWEKAFKKDTTYRWRGYELMKRVERWAEKQPRGEVRVTSIDDSYFSGSDLVLIEHRTRRQYMGTTEVIIPQTTGEAPMEFFLYPSDMIPLIKALKEIRAAARPIERIEAKDEKDRAVAIEKNIQHPPVLT